MKDLEHADAVLDRVLGVHPWILDSSKRAGRGRLLTRAIVGFDQALPTSQFSARTDDSLASA